MLHVKLSVRQTDIIPAAKTATDKSKPTLNKNNSGVQDEVGEQKQTDREDPEGRTGRMGRGGTRCLRVHLLDPANLFH